MIYETKSQESPEKDGEEKEIETPETPNEEFKEEEEDNDIWQGVGTPA